MNDREFMISYLSGVRDACSNSYCALVLDHTIAAIEELMHIEDIVNSTETQDVATRYSMICEIVKEATHLNIGDSFKPEWSDKT